VGSACGEYEYCGGVEDIGVLLSGTWLHLPLNWIGFVENLRAWIFAPQAFITGGCSPVAWK
jgi:hypothetical protein